MRFQVKRFMALYPVFWKEYLKEEAKSPVAMSVGDFRALRTLCETTEVI
jgi:hypothetical protein